MLPAPQYGWTRFLSLTRAVLAAGSLATVYRQSEHPPAALLAVLGVYFVYAAVVAVRGVAHKGILGLLALFADVVLFLALIGTSGVDLYWLTTMFYLFLLTEALTFYGPWEVVMIGLLAAAYCFVLRGESGYPLAGTLVVAGTLAVGFAVQRRRLNAQMAGLQAQLGEAALAPDKACEAERQRIAADFHDGPLQSLISLQMRLEILRKLLERDFSAGMVDLMQLQSLALSQVRDLRAFLHSMRPADVDGANLVATARRTAETFQKESGIPVTFLGSKTPVGLPPEATVEVLQMLREALHNVQKHAGATRVAVTMEKSAGGLEITVDDNGHGFGFSGAYTLEELELLRLGPASLKRRARSLNADMLLESRPGRGAGLKVRIPLQ